MKIYSDRRSLLISRTFLFCIAVVTQRETFMVSDATSIMPRSSYAPDINYGGNHPFEQTQKESNTKSGLETSRNTQTLSSVFEPLRIVYDLENLETLLSLETELSEITKMNTLINTILPQAKDVWNSVLSVAPVVGNLLIGADPVAAREQGRFTNCPHVYDPVPHNHSLIGVPDADLVIYVSIGGGECSGNFDTVLPLGVPCELDQFDRPIGGILTYCLDNIQLDRDGEVTKEVSNLAISTVIHEIGHILGMNTELLKFFRNPKTGEPLTPRPFQLTEESCVNGPILKVYKPGCNTLQLRNDTDGMIYYEIVTPTVLQVVRNQFDCQFMTGARIENQPGTETNCFGSNWDQRLFLMEAMATPPPVTEFILSPLTLALLEDSGWYKANYGSEYVKINPFGHGAGCDFVSKKCLIDKGLTIPSYSKGYFCNDPLKFNRLGLLDGKYGCDASHRSKSFCDLVDYDSDYFSQFNSPPTEKFQYFENPNLGSFNYRTDYCPVALTSEAIKCDNTDSEPLFIRPNEFYGKGSRCFNTVESNREPLCLKSECKGDKTLEIYVGNFTYKCSRSNQIHEQPNGEGTIECPRLESICPQFFCPANCAGRGVCNMVGNNPDCVCFDLDDDSDGCFNSEPISPEMNVELCGDSSSSSLMKTGKIAFFTFFMSIIIVLH